MSAEPPYQPPQSYEPQQKPPSRVNAGRVWAGGVGTAVVVALVIIVSILLLRGVFGIPVLAPEGEGAYGGTADTTTYALAGALIALVATGVLHVLLLGMPNPMTFFYWIAVLITAVAVILPFTFISDDVAGQLATAGINLLAGICLMSVLGSVGSASVRENRRAQGQTGQRRGGYGY